MRGGLADLESLDGRWDLLEAAGGFGQHFSAPSFALEVVVSSGRGREGCLVRLNGGQVAADILRSLREDSSSKEERKRRRRDKDSSSSSSAAAESKETRSSEREGEQAGKKELVGRNRTTTVAAEKRKAGKYFLIGDYPALNSKVGSK